MMKNIRVKTSLLGLVILLTGCNNNPLIFSPYLFDEEEFVTTKEDIEASNYYQNEKYDSISYVDYYGQNQTINTYRDLFSSTNIAQKFLNANSIGDLNVLVIPINFLDSDTTKNEEQLVKLQSAFFGDESCVSYESLASFYYKSSYGQLKINGHISEFYNHPYSSRQIVSMNSSPVSASRKVAFDAMKWFYENNPEFNYSLYDLDEDTYFDAVYFMYNYPYVSDGTDNGIFWAFADHTFRGEKGNGDVANNFDICLSTYTWISIDFLGKGKKPDSKTIIHESGHVFGLDDYYNTSNTGIYQPTGFADMMDANIGDHTGLSKMLLNWTTPKVVTGEGEITLSPFYDTGDLILIPTSKGYNNTPYDEYLLLEYFSPNGLNKNDAGVRYVYNRNGKEETFSFFSNPGLKVYHVDARLGIFSFKNTNSLISTLDDPLLENKIQDYKSTMTRAYCVDFAFSNDVLLGREDTTNTLYAYLESSNISRLKQGYAASYQTLWHEGSHFGVTAQQNFTFNNGGNLQYTFKVDKITNEQVTITFIKK